MDKTLAQIPVGELVENPMRVLARVVRERKPIALEKRGKVVVLLTPWRRHPPHRRKRTKDLKAFLAAAGSWRIEDTDTLIADLYASRKRASRPAVEL